MTVDDDNTKGTEGEVPSKVRLLTVQSISSSTVVFRSNSQTHKIKIQALTSRPLEGKLDGVGFASTLLTA